MKTFPKSDMNVKRGTVKGCSICLKQFGFRDEHQCKRCLRPICEKCGKTKRDVYKIGMEKTPHRLCTVCTKQSDFLKEYIQRNQLKFGQDSPIVKKWIKKIPDITIEDIPQATKQSKQQKLSFETWSEIWDSYNFSMRELIGVLTYTKNQQDIYKQANTVYEKLIESGFYEPMDQVLYLIMFLLCYSNPKTCLKLLKYLIALRKTVSEGKELLQAYLKALGVEQSNTKRINDYLNSKLKQFMGTLSVNVITVQCTIHLISRIIEKGKIEQAYILLALVIEDNMAFLTKHKDQRKDCDTQLFRKTSIDSYLSKYSLVRNVKTAQFVLINKKINGDGNTFQKKSSSFDDNQPSNESFSFQKQDDKLSHRTKSFKDSEISNSPYETLRKTAKLNDSNFIQSQNIYSSNDCGQCELKNRKIHEFQNRLKEKQKWFSDLSFKYMRRRQQEVVFNRDRLPSQCYSKQNQQISQLEREIIERSTQNQNIHEELRKFKTQNLTLMSKLNEMEMNNRMLNNRLESSLMFPNTLKSMAKDEQGKVIDMLKFTLDTKNKQLEELMKRNKILEYQLTEVQKQKSLTSNVFSIGDGYLNKIEQLSKQVNEQQNQKLSLASELFQLKQFYKNSQEVPQTKQQDKKKSECLIF